MSCNEFIFNYILTSSINTILNVILKLVLSKSIWRNLVAISDMQDQLLSTLKKKKNIYSKPETNCHMQCLNNVF